MRNFRRILSLFLLMCCTVCGAQTNVDRSSAYRLPRREFRGAWIQCVNGQFMGLSPEAMRQNLTRQLDVLEECGVNAVIFQVRAEGDALYASELEPWSRFLTGTQGVAPTPCWDPLAWMVEEAHRRGMELHAWINPFRAKTAGTKELAATHPYVAHPERCFAYGNLLLFDPGIEENCAYICHVAADIVRRYDVDGLHIDDYFYPYPQAGVDIPDWGTYEKNPRGQRNIEDWRRGNVNRFIQALSDSIHTVKPWVKFGVSPFGIYHNARPGDVVPGSATAGLQNFDDLYADVLLWARNGWVDYIAPQVYWEIGHKVADYATLVQWWAKECSMRPLFIGQDVLRTVKYADTERPGRHQQEQKFALQRGQSGVQGSVMWYSAALVSDDGGYATALRENFHKYPALQPLFPFLDDVAPGKVSGLTVRTMPDGKYLFWNAPKLSKDARRTPLGSNARELDEAKAYAVYRFEKGESTAALTADHLLTITRHPLVKLPEPAAGTYVVIALDRLQNESKPVKKKIK